jgi:two-component sensor histidine kinase
VWEGIWCFYEDKKGNMWFGTFDGRLIKYDGEIFTYFTQSFGGGIYQVNEDSYGNIWIAANGGLVKFDGKHFYQYNEILGMNNRNLTSMMQDKKGDIWIGTTNGLKYLEKSSGEQNINPRVTDFSSHNGLIGELFQINAALLDSKGNAWWGTNRTVNKLDTKLISPDTTTPAMQLRFLNVGGRQIDFHHLKDSQSVAGLTASYKNIKYYQTSSFNNYPVNPVFPFTLNHLTFNFSAIDWSAPNQLKYSYMVEGLDDKWSDLSSENTADYRNIPYGNYTFKVKAIGVANKWSNIFEYSFKINPPWWHTWWFRSIAVLAMLLVIYMYVRYRTKSLRERQKYLQQTVEKRTEQLRVSLAEKEVLLKEIHHRVKNNLEVISSLLRLQTKNVTDENAKSALIEGQNRVQSIALIHHKLYGSDDLANIEIKDFAKGLFDHISKVFKKPDEKINFIASGNDTFVNTDIAVPVGLILNELFTNAFKYAIQAGRENILSLKINETLAGDKEIYQMIFSDNGAGMPESFILEKSKSLGMKVIHLLTKQLGGELKYYNKDGAVFEISFPKPNSDPSFIQKV